MKSFLSPPRLFILGFVLILIANAVALLGVASNRSGKPEAVIELTERELRLPYNTNDENSGLALRLDWRIVPEYKDEVYLFSSHWGSPTWFNTRKLTELGFIIDETSCPDETSKRKIPVPKEAFLVLEYEGPAYQEALQKAEMFLKKAELALKGNEKDKDLLDRFEKAKNHLEAEHISESRLFAIDAGLDAGQLRQRYPDPSRFIIIRGIVELDCRSEKNNKEVTGRIADIRIDKINVPLSYRKFFDSIQAQDKYEKGKPKSPRYKVEVAYGKHFEPWIQKIGKWIK